MTDDPSFRQALVTIDRALVELRAAIDRDDNVRLALDKVLAAVPADVWERAQHPLTVTGKELRGSVRQWLDARSDTSAEWYPMVRDGALAAMEAFEVALVKLQREGEGTH